MHCEEGQYCNLRTYATQQQQLHQACTAWLLRSGQHIHSYQL
jgi:hypothetical protein